MVLYPHRTFCILSWCRAKVTICWVHSIEYTPFIYCDVHFMNSSPFRTRVRLRARAGVRSRDRVSTVQFIDL